MANLYVRKCGADAANGTSASTAKLTINGALNAAANGDTIYVGNGTYTDDIGNGVSAKSNITLVADITGTYTGDRGKVILNPGANNFTNTNTWTNLTVKNFICNTTASYPCYTSNGTTKFINCVFYGANGISSVSKFYNCTISGPTYAWTSNMGLSPAAVVNCIVNGPLDTGVTIPSANNYKIATFTEIFQDRVNNNWNINATYVANVKDLGTTGADVPTTDIYSRARGVTPWIGAYDVGSYDILAYCGGTFRTSVTDLELGDMMRCSYEATSSAVGQFGKLGTLSVSDKEIPYAGANPPNTTNV
jgi:hypothetical protein